jgi:hypothetical protein
MRGDGDQLESWQPALIGASSPIGLAELNTSVADKIFAL